MPLAFLALLAGCATSTETCTFPLADACGDCPASVADAEADCPTLGSTQVPSSPSCDGFDVVRCSGTNTTAELWMFAGDQLVAHASQECPTPDPHDEAPCQDQGGWTLYGDATADVLACLKSTTSDLYCYE